MAAIPDPDFGGNRIGGSGRGRRVMVIDDERHIIRLMQVNLERAGFQVCTAFDGKKALQQIACFMPDLIILDMSLPDMDGLSVLQVLRQNIVAREIPILILTRAPVNDFFRDVHSGADAAISKPFNPMELLALIRMLLGF